MSTETQKPKSIPGECATPRGRVAFAKGAFEPKIINGEPKYGYLLVFNREKVKDDPAWQAIKDILNRAAAERFEVEGYRSKVKGKPLDTPFFTHEHYEFIGEDEVAIRLNTKYKPEVVDADGETYLEDESEFYSGCIARATYAATAYDVEGSRGVKLQLNNTQKVGAGKRYKGSRKKASEEFDAVEPEVADIDDSEEGSEEQDF